MTKRSAVLGALSLLSASMGLSLTSGKAVAGKSKTADKSYNAMENYIKAAKPNPGNGTTTTHKSGGSSKRK